MNRAGIEAINAYGGMAFVDVAELARHRSLDPARFANLLMHEKAVALPHEDPVTCAANAARPIIDSLDEAGRRSIELLVTCTESGIDFGKSLSTYLHHHLELSRNCRLFEIKQACYSGTAGLQMAINFVLSQTAPGARALIVATDISRFTYAEGTGAAGADWSYAEPSAGAGAVAVLVGASPEVFDVDVGANGYYGYEVMDTCRPEPDSEAGDIDLSLTSYLDCCERSFEAYRQRVRGADYGTSFQYLSFHTPFGGMVKGAHRTMMRRLLKSSAADIELDFERRVRPGLTYCQRVGNIMGGTVLLSLASTIDHGNFSTPRRIGCFSYGSGCCSEFFSGIATARSQERQRRFGIGRDLDDRYRLSMQEYERVLHASSSVRFGTRNVDIDSWLVPGVQRYYSGKRRLLLRRIRNFHREYEWTA